MSEADIPVVLWAVGGWRSGGVQLVRVIVRTLAEVEPWACGCSNSLPPPLRSHSGSCSHRDTIMSSGEEALACGHCRVRPTLPCSWQWAFLPSDDHNSPFHPFTRSTLQHGYWGQHEAAQNNDVDVLWVNKSIGQQVYRPTGRGPSPSGLPVTNFVDVHPSEPFVCLLYRRPW